MSVAAVVVTYRFDGFVLDLVRAALVTDKGENVPVRHKSFRLLCLFVENAGSSGRTRGDQPSIVAGRDCHR